MMQLQQRVTTVAMYAVAPVLAVLLWWAAAAVINSAFFPDPATAMVSLVRAFTFESFRENFLITVRTLALAFAIAAVIGLLVGLTAGTSRTLLGLISPVMHLLNSTPKIVFFPVFLLILGLNETSRVVFAVFHGVFIVVIVVMAATANLRPQYRKVIDVYRLNKVTAWRMVIVPALLPHVLAAVRLCLAFTFIGLVLAELLSGTYGLGSEILRRMQLARVGEITGIVVLIVAMAVAPVMLLRALEERVRSKYEPVMER